MPISRRSRLAAARATVLVLGALWGALTQAAMGLSTIAATADDGPITLYYPSDGPARTVIKGPFTLQVASEAAPKRGNGRLVVLSHGSGGSPWVHADLARALVDAGFMVALPQHRADNHLDHSRPGPDSWQQRPAEVSRAIDAVARDPRFAALVDTTQVGVWGMSAGGHTALSLAGGSWSRAGFKRHCEAHLADDFSACVGLITRLRGNGLDGLKQWIALTVIRLHFGDDTPQVHHDPRVAAVVAGVPFAADFDMQSLARPRVPLALVTAGRDAWLVPRFHGDRVLQACRPACEHLADLPTAGHGALLSPPPPKLTGLVGELLNDPPEFDRSVLSEVDRQVVGFFLRHLLRPGAADAQTTTAAGR